MSKKSRTHENDAPIFEAALALDILAALLAGGASLTTGLKQLAENLPGAQALGQIAGMLQLGIDWDTAWQPVAEDENFTELAELGRQLHFVHTSAVPSAQLLSSMAEVLRRQRKRRAEQLAAQLGIKLVVPMGVCLLPSFICLGVLPLLISLLPSL